MLVDDNGHEERLTCKGEAHNEPALDENMGAAQPSREAAREILGRVRTSILINYFTHDQVPVKEQDSAAQDHPIRLHTKSR